MIRLRLHRSASTPDGTSSSRTTAAPRRDRRMPTQPRPQVVIPLSDEPCTDGIRFAPEVAANRIAGDPSFRPARPWCCWAPPPMSARPPPSRAANGDDLSVGLSGGKGDLRVREISPPRWGPQLADPLTRRSGSTEPNRDANRANDGLAVELRPVGQLLLREVPALGAQRGCGWRCAPQPMLS